MIKKIKEVKPNEVLDFAIKYFPNFKVLENPFEKVYAYYIDDAIVGFISSSIIYERAEIEYFVVKEEYRGKGIAKELLEYFISNIKDGDNISLEVRCSNERAINFYLKNGFKKVATRDKYYGKDDGYLMIKELR